MTTTSGSTTQNATSVATPAELSGLPDDGFVEGDLAYVQSLWPLASFRLRRGTPPSPPDNVSIIDTLSGSGYWEVFGASPVSSTPAFDTVADLGAYLEGLPNGATAYVRSIRSYFNKVFGPAVATDGITTVANAAGDATWYRSEVRSPSWQRQAVWYIDPTGGDDEGAGTAIGPLQTFAEFARRLQNVSLYTTVNVVDDTTESFQGLFIRRAVVAELHVAAVPRVLASGSTTTYVNISEATNLRGTVTCAEIVDLTPYIGKMLRSTALGKVTPLLAVVGGVGQVGEWSNLTATSYSPSVPANGTTLQVLDNLDAGAPNLVTFCGLHVVLYHFRYSDSPTVEARNTVFPTYFFGCEFEGDVLAIGYTLLFSSLFSGVSGTIANKRTIISVISGGSLDRAITFGQSFGRLNVQGFVCQGGPGVVIDGGEPGSNVKANARLALVSAALGVFDVQGDAITVRNGGIMTGPGRAFGQGSTGYGVKVETGGRVILAGQPLYITANTGQVQIGGAVTAIPPLVAGGNVPAASALTTWAQWGAAPFSRKVVNYSDLSKIIGA